MASYQYVSILVLVKLALGAEHLSHSLRSLIRSQFLFW